MESVHPRATLVALLERRRRDTPARVAFRFPGDGGGRELTDEALGRRAAALAAALLERCRPGERALLLYPPGLDYVVALFGCLLAGVVAVPAYPPRPNNSLRRLEDLAADAQASLALTTAQVARSVGRLVQASPLLVRLAWLSTDALPDAEPPADAERASPHTLAVIQYTSGSTGSAKGVMLTHASLLHNLEQIRRRFGHDAASRGVIWLPPYHDMGLIGGILQPLYAGFTCDLMGPAGFLTRPLSWLEAIAASRATTSGGPNFAYELVLKRSTPEQRAALDLSSWSVAFAGAEPVRADTLERFAAAFACAGFRREAFYPCYGLAEATLMVSGGRRLEPPRVLSLEPRALEEHRVEPAPEARRGRALVGCGTCLDDQLMAIVDPATGTLCGPDRVGEIWVAGPSVAAGYWGRPDETERVFGARLPGSDARFLRTGDLGFVRDGHLFPTGRLKDLIILRGANHYPEDIEASVTESHASLRRAGSAAFGVDAEGEERLVVVQELERGARPDTLEVLRAIRRNVAWHHGLQPLALLLVGPNTLPRTSSGKLRRHECRRRFLAGEFQPVAEWREQPGEPAAPLPERVARPAAPVIERWLVDHFAGLLGVPPGEIDVRQPFAYYGLDSAQAVQLARDLEGWLGVELPSTLAWDHPTLEALARHLAAPGSAPAVRPARPVAEPIAVIGLACRLPGAPNADALWELLRSGRDAVSEVPAERFDAAALYDPDPAAGGRLSSRWGAFLSDADRFDPYFFGIVPREAVHMDPQQRLLLESAWEALEDAGRAPETLAGSATGVFVGLSNVDYTTLQLRFRRHLEAIDAYTGTGSAHCIAANRLSYLLDLHGPSVAIDTACSSALVALHLAARSLAARECDLALCGGVNLILGPETTVAFSRARMLAADGRCKPFDARADGFVRGEGCVTLVLARLSDAQRDGDRILGVLRGSATNQDGRTNGLTAPNGPAQEAVLRAALADAGLSPAEVDFVEAHGTGTALGDPIEIGALSNVMGGVPRPQPCAVASMKANIGHLEPAAGLAGVAKVLLCLRHEALPPQAGLERLNPDLRLGGVLEIPRELRPWPRGDRPRRAGVSAFGFGGTNAHVLLEEPPPPPPPAPPAGRSAWFLPLSAHTPRALGLQAGRFADWLEARPDLSLDDVCATAAALRAGRICRAAGVGTSRAELVSRLRGVAAAPPAAPAGHAPRVAFLFTGQGSQYAGMARGLYAAEPVFRAALDRCAALLEGRLDLPLLPLLEGVHGEAALEATAHAQPLLFALEYALVELWRAWGVVPGALLGHSVGEYVAACVAGVMSHEDALALVAARGRLMQALPPDGGMLAVQAGAEELAAFLAPFEGRVALAAVNAPGRAVLSGARDALASLRASFAQARIECRELSVSHAFHSPLLEPMLPAFEAEAARVSWRAPEIALVSNLTGDYLHAAPDATYWRRHARACVRFADGVGRLLADGYDTFIEIGPAPVLSSLGRRHPAAGPALFLPSLRRPEPDHVVALQSAAALYEAGLGLNWEALCGRPGARRVALPELPFERERYWAEEPAGGEDDEPVSRAAGHALAARRLRTAAPMFEARLSPGTFAYLREHRLRDEALVPAAAFVEAALEAAHLATSSEALELEHVVFRQALFLAADGPAPLLQTQLLPETDGFEFRLASADAGPQPAWTLHVTGRARAMAAPAAPEALDPGGLRATCSDPRDLNSFYATLQARGLNYGSAFRGVAELWSGRREALGRVALPAGLQAAEARVHPALLDACFQVLAGALPRELLEQAPEPYLPAEIERLKLYRAAPDAALFVHARLDEHAPAGTATLSGSLRAVDGDGRPVFDVQGFRLRRLGLQAARPRAPLAEAVYALTWEPVPREPARALAEPGSFLVLGDDDAFSAELATRLEAAGQVCVCAPWPSAGDDDGRTLAALLAEAEQSAPLRGVLGLRLSSARDVSAERVVAATRAALHVLRGLAARSSVARPPRLVLATRGAQAVGSSRATACEQATLVGLARVASVEHPELGCKLIDLDPSGRDGVDELLAEVLAESGSGESAWRGGQRLVPSLTPHALASPSASEGETARLATPASAAYCLDSQAPGSLERLVLRPSAWPDEPPPGCVEIEIDATGLNFSDVLKAMGLYPGVTDSPLPLGAECAGRVLRTGAGVAGLAPGDAVLGVAPFCFGNRSVTDARLLAPIPATLSCEQAAAVPIAFLTAYYALDRLARLRAGESVLIHAAAGGVGLAAVQIARRAGARIFATAGSPEKRDTLSALGLEHVFDSRDAAFAERIRERTGGEGVDVVLNSLPGDAIPRSLGLLRPYGRFLEIGKIDIYQDRKLGLLPFSRSLSYFAIDLDRLLRDRTDEVGQLLRELVELLARGELRPLPLTAFDLDDAVAAFRYMAQRRNTGKIVLRRAAGAAPVAHAPWRGDATYLVTGGLGGIGLRLAEWLAARGVRHLALLARRPPVAEQAARLAALRGRGVDVRVVLADVSDADELGRALAQLAQDAPPLRGVLHAAGRLDDGALLQFEAARLDALLAPKVAGTWNLHAATRDCPLDLFVLFASAATLLGSPGQAGYAAANAFLDAFASIRHAQGLPVTVVDWGPWAEVGMAARGDNAERLARQGLEPIAPDEAFALLERLIRGAEPGPLAVLPARWGELLARYPSRGVPTLLRRLAAEHQAPAARGSGGLDRRRLLEAPAAERHGLLELQLRGHLSRVAGIPLERIDVRQPLTALGVDSLTALELKNGLEASLEVSLPMARFMEGPSIERLVALVVAQLSATAEDGAAAAPRRTGALSPPLVRRARGGPAPLSASQERLLRRHAQGRAAALPLMVRLEGELDLAALERAWAALTRRQHMLRTRLVLGEGEPCQDVDADAGARLSVAPEALPAAEGASVLRQRLAQACAGPFDVQRGPLVRATLARVSAAEHALLVAAHPLAFDAPSRAILVSELARLYDAVRREAEAELPELPVQFGDYAAWQRAWLAPSPALSASERGGGGPPAGASPRACLPVPLSRAAGVALQHLALEHALDPRVPWLACLLTALHAARRTADARLGCTAANRSRVGIESLIGPLANFVTLPADASGEPTFLQLLERLREGLAGALRDEDRPWELSPSGATRDELPGLDTLWASLAFERAADCRGDSVRFVSVPHDPQLDLPDHRPRAALELALWQGDDQAQATLNFATAQVDAAQAEQLARALAATVERAAADPQQRLASLHAALREQTREGE